MPGAKYLEKMANEKSPGVGARKRFLLEWLLESKNRKRLIAAINNVCERQNTILYRMGGEKRL